MRVFVTGASGFIGSAVVDELLDAGHQVLGLARSDASAAALERAGATVHRGDLEDLESLRAGAAAADAVIHTAFVHDFANIAASGAIDRHAVEVFAEAGKPFVITSGTAVLPQGRVGAETDEPERGSHGAFRIPSEDLALAHGGSVMRFPPSVHGEGDHGFVPVLIAIARERGRSVYIGDGANRWPAVHRLDAARAFRLAIERAPAGSVLHGVAEEGIPTRAIAEVIGRHLDVPVASIDAGSAADHFGWIGGFFARNVPASSTRTRDLLGWTPVGPGLLEDLSAGHYFAVPAVA